MKEPTIVPSGFIVHTGAAANRPGGTEGGTAAQGAGPTPPPKPEPDIETAVPPEPELGKSRSRGKTVKPTTGAASNAGVPLTVRAYPPNVDKGATTNDPERTPVLPSTSHDRLEMMFGADVTVHEVSDTAKPVPVTVTVVPGIDPSTGEPKTGLSVTAAVTVKITVAEESP